MLACATTAAPTAVTAATVATAATTLPFMVCRSTVVFHRPAPAGCFRAIRRILGAHERHL